MMLNWIFKTGKSHAFIWIFLTTFILYGLSSRFPAVVYLIPTVILLLFIILHTKTLQVGFDTLTSMLLIMLLVYVFFLLIGGVAFFQYEHKVKLALYYLLDIIPLAILLRLIYLRYGEYSFINGLYLSFVLVGLLLFVLLYVGYFPSNRYQHVGNILGATAILSFSLSISKQKQSILFIIFLFLLLTTGSRQALAGILFAGLVYLILNGWRWFLLLLALSILILIFKDQLLEWLIDLSDKYDLRTLHRTFHAFTAKGGGSSVSTRMEIYTNLFNSLHFFPDPSFIADIKARFPHNYFLEYALTAGAILGVFFIIFIGYILLKVCSTLRRQPILYFVLMYFVPFNISSGIAAAKYFLIFLFVLIAFMEFRRVPAKRIKALE